MRFSLPFALAALFATPVLAQTEASTPAIFTIELNALQSTETGCRVSFLATNGFDQTVDRASLETAFFNADGAIERIVTLDFKALTPGKTKVLQFGLSNLDCANVGRVLINDITACDGTDLDAKACLAALTTSTRTDITFGL